MKRILFAALFCLSLSAVSFGQATAVQQSATDAQACSVSSQTAAVNNQVTVTITPPQGQFVYVCGIDVSSSQDGTSTANTNLQYTSTNLGGWSWKYSLAATVNAGIFQPFYFNHPIKSAQAGTAVTVVSPTGTLHTAFSINVYYYFGQ